MNNNLFLLETKLTLKKWESEFYQKNGMKPKISDIANSEIEKIYKVYASIKNKVEEEKKKKIDSSSSKKRSEKENSEVWNDSLLKKKSSIKDKKEDDSEKEVKTVIQDANSKPEKNVDTSLNKRQIIPTNIKFVPTKTLKKQNTLPKTLNNNEDKTVSSADFLKSGVDSIYSFQSPGFKSIESLELARNSIKLKERADSFKRFRIKKLTHRSINEKWLKPDSEVKEALSENPEDNDKKNNSSVQSDTKSLENQPSKPIDCSVTIKPTTEGETKPSDSTPQSTKSSKESNYESSCNEIDGLESSQSNKKEIASKDTDEVEKTSNKKETFRKKSSNLVSNNFVRVQIKKKSYSRNGNASAIRRQIYKSKLSKKNIQMTSGWKGRSGGLKRREFRDKSEDKCFKCGGTGHWVDKCTGASAPTDTPVSSKSSISIEEILKGVNLDINMTYYENHVRLNQVDPVFTEDNYDCKQVSQVLSQFGYKSFRSGQDDVIKRVLCGKSTVAVLSTGFGKSLCYQLPAYMYFTTRNSLTLVISPLVSLMDDQVQGLPKFLKAARIHSGLSKLQRDKVMKQVEDGEIAILLVSPEAVTSWAGMSMTSSPLSRLPSISFVCIDECHCISDWSHNFRPSYLRVCQVLSKQLGVDRLVGLTATANRATCDSIARYLEIEDTDRGVVTNMDLPLNLSISVSKDNSRNDGLETLLKGERFSKLDSVIIYCTRRETVTSLASFLRSKYEQKFSVVEEYQEEVDESGRKRKRSLTKSSSKKHLIQWEADCYHAGMSSAERKRVQKRFMSGNLRIVVATVAFGMGIDKKDVRAVIHYDMPPSIDRFVQEIGRAGRDGLKSHCHMFLQPDGDDDMFELRRHIYAKTVDRVCISKLIRKIFSPCDCLRRNVDCLGHYAGLPVDKTIEELDISKEGIETLLCYLESKGYLEVNLSNETVCQVRCYEGTTQMARVAKKCPVVSTALRLREKSEQIGNVFKFSIIEVANQLSANYLDLKRSLHLLSRDTSLSIDPTCKSSSGVTIEFFDVSFVVRTLKTYSVDLIDEITDYLHNRMMRQENKDLSQLQRCFEIMNKFAKRDSASCMDSYNEEETFEMKKMINEYFQEVSEDTERSDPAPITSEEENDIRSLFKQFLMIHGEDLDHPCSGRVLARIFHGIQSPRYPAKTWARAGRFWRTLIHIDFNFLIRIATEEIIQWM